VNKDILIKKIQLGNTLKTNRKLFWEPWHGEAQMLKPQKKSPPCGLHSTKFCSVFFFFPVVLGFELRAFKLASQAVYHLGHSSALFMRVIF
jgi:hypothetical protein